ncbi:glutaredoxin [Thermincola ferriacetica]|uniref:Glutaredoxin n=1 Tax=Thermincola ferriacetica TaxID=281456 RepID=A0A0L6W4L7_9FIRM|nr:glutaredoxin [Thermincola ferriacetica]
MAEDPTAREEMITQTKSMAVPTSIIDGEVVIGFDKSKIERLLQ